MHAIFAHDELSYRIDVHQALREPLCILESRRIARTSSSHFADGCSFVRILAETMLPRSTAADLETQTHRQQILEPPKSIATALAVASALAEATLAAASITATAVAAGASARDDALGRGVSQRRFAGALR